MFPAVSRGHLGPCLAERQVSKPHYTLRRRQGLLDSDYEKGQIFPKSTVHFYSSPTPGNSTSGWGACHTYTGDFCKLHMPTSSQILIHPSGRTKGNAPVLLHENLCHGKTL